MSQADDKGTKDIEIIVPLNYLYNFWRTLKIPLIKCETNLISTWSANSVTVYTAVANQGETFAINDTKLYVLVVTLWSQEKCKAIRSSKTKF